jgi:hypothetical protein
MPRSVSPPISPKTIRHPKRSRQPSKDELSVQELSQDDDCGYDGDVEIVRPDQYEEPETDSEEDKDDCHLIPDIDEEITRGMRQLGWRQAPARLQMSGLPAQQDPDAVDSSPLNRYGKRAEFDVAEVMNGQGPAPPAKRRKKRGSRSNIAQRFVKAKPHMMVSDSSDRTEGKQPPLLDTSTGSTGASDLPPVLDGDEMVLD